MEYSAVTQPFPELRKNGGTVSSIVAAHNTCVLPTLISAEPSAVMRTPVVISTRRICAGPRLSVRIAHHKVEEQHYQQHSGDHQNDARKTGLRRNRSLGFLPSYRLEFRHHCDSSIGR